MRYLIIILFMGCCCGAAAQTADLLPAALVNQKWHVKKLQSVGDITDNELFYRFKRPNKDGNLDVTIKGNVIIPRTWYDRSVPGAPAIAIREDQNAPVQEYEYVKTRYTDKGKKEHIFFEKGFRRNPLFEQLRLEHP